MIVRLLRVFMAGFVFVFAAGAQAQGQEPKPWYVALGVGGAWYDDSKIGGAGSASMDTGFTLNGALREIHRRHTGDSAGRGNSVRQGGYR